MLSPAEVRLLLAVLLPAVVQAALEAALFGQHQRERQRAGLPPERGWQASTYALLGRVADALDGPSLAAALWVALGVLFDLSVVWASNESTCC